MNKPRIGSLFSGVGGLDLAVEEVTGGETIWQVEFDKNAAKVLAKRCSSTSRSRYRRTRARRAPTGDSGSTASTWRPVASAWTRSSWGGFAASTRSSVTMCWSSTRTSRLSPECPAGEGGGTFRVCRTTVIY
ncbi:DNA methylase [Mycobacterium phage Topanga]|nr:DNA methylase [Mycobacterium phage Topanga]